MKSEHCSGAALLAACEDYSGLDWITTWDHSCKDARHVVDVLRPSATRRDRICLKDVRLLTDWRNRFNSSFLTEFHATEEQTTRWLVDVVGPSSNKILFMVDDLAGCPFGYMGLAFIDWERCSGEADAIVRGGDAPPGTMASPGHGGTPMSCAESQLVPTRIGVRVRSDSSALAFYRKVGFVESHAGCLGLSPEAGDDQVVRRPNEYDFLRITSPYELLSRS